MRIRVLAKTLVLALVLAPAPALAQEADVRAALAETLASWKSGDFETFAGFYHEDARGFFLDGGPMTGGFSVAAMEAAQTMGFETHLDFEDVEVSVYDGVATAAGYLVGSLVLPGGATMDGTWRYTDTRVLEGGIWKVVQFHFSQQQDAG